MDKTEYFKISHKLNLPFRCPILDICERRMLSIFFNSYTNSTGNQNIRACLIKNNIINIERIEEIIEIKGEEPDCIKGKSIKAFNNFCPEVNLFDSEHAFPWAKETACISGEWDDFRKTNNKFKPYKSCHYSECPEFNYYLSQELLKKKGRRVTISKHLRFEVLQRDKFTCQYCGRKVEDGAKLHVDHKIPVFSGGKTEFNNLITSCEDCNLGKSNTDLKVNLWGSVQIINLAS